MNVYVFIYMYICMYVHSYVPTYLPTYLATEKQTSTVLRPYYEPEHPIPRTLDHAPLL